MTAEGTRAGRPERPAPRHEDWELYEPVNIRRAVPLQWAFGHYYDLWDASGEMSLCPFHGEDTASFNLWAADDDGIPQRFGCFGCGKSGDVIDLIREATGGGFNDACRIAVEELMPMIGDWTPTATVKSKEHLSPEALERILDGLKPMDAVGFDALLTFMRRKGLNWEEVQRFAVEEWDWGGTVMLGPTVYFPHRDWNGALTGIKYRDPRRDGRWNEDGSQFPYLYGSWRDHGWQDVFLAEGETDTVYASYQLRHSQIEVFGMPSGANQRPTEEMAERLKGRRLYVCGDGDAAGSTMNKAWYESGLAQYIIRMPEGEDVLSCGVGVHELMSDYSRQPRVVISAPRIGVQFGRFVRVEEKENPKTHEKETKTVPLGDFSFRPKRELLTEEGPVWEGDLSGTMNEVLLRNADLVDLRAFRKWLRRNGARAFTGTGNDVELLVNWIGSKADYLPLERSVTKAGRIGRSFVIPGQPTIGNDRVRYMAPSRGDASLADKLHIVQGPYELRAIKALERLNDPGTMAIILGWLTATLLRGERAPAPPLFVAGESGSGKTHLIQTVLDSFGFDIGANLTTTTPFGVDSLVSSVIGFPVWFDEYRTGARVDSMERLRQVLRDAYNGQQSLKGGMSNNATELTEITTWAGIIVSGEMGTSETSLRDRLVYLELNPEARNKNAYDYLRGDTRLTRGRMRSARTTGLGDTFLTYLAGIPPAAFRVAEVGDPSLPDRFRQTMGFIDAGWTAWLGFRQYLGMDDTPTGPDFDALGATRADSADPWIDALRHAEGMMDRNSRPICTAQDGNLTIIPIEVVREARNADIVLPAGEKELLQWLRRRYPVEATRVDTRRAYVVRGIDLDKE